MYFRCYDSSIQECYEAAGWFFDCSCFLLTVMDSSPETYKSLELSEIDLGARKCGPAVLMPGDAIAQVLRYESMFRYSEIYFFVELSIEDALHVCDQKLMYFTPDISSFTHETPVQFAKQFADLGAYRYLSDGDALNFASKIESDALRFDELFEVLKA